MFLSVRNQLQETRQAFDAGADAYMTKPFSAEKLLAKIESIISKAEMLKEIKAAKPV
jgi:DNA-binding response OmpR family regulator